MGGSGSVTRVHSMGTGCGEASNPGSFSLILTILAIVLDLILAFPLTIQGIMFARRIPQRIGERGHSWEFPADHLFRVLLRAAQERGRRAECVPDHPSAKDPLGGIPLRQR